MRDADLIIANGKVVTLDPASRVAEAVACRGERIAAVGSTRDVRTMAGAGAKVVDAGGRTIVPGLIDGHAHMDREGLRDVFPSLEGCRSIRDVLDRVHALAAAAEPGEWIVTMPVGDPPYYWNVPGCLRENRFPTRRELDEGRARQSGLHSPHLGLLAPYPASRIGRQHPRARSRGHRQGQRSGNRQHLLRAGRRGAS